MNNPVTQKQLREEFDRFRKEDLKSEFKSFKIELMEEVREEVAILIEKSEERMGNRVDTKIDKVITTLDHIAGELESMRTEQTISNQHFEDLTNQVIDHKGQITKIEEVTNN